MHLLPSMHAYMNDRMIRRADCYPAILAGLCITCAHALLRDMGRSVLDAEMKISIPKNETVKLQIT